MKISMEPYSDGDVIGVYLLLLLSGRIEEAEVYRKRIEKETNEK